MWETQVRILSAHFMKTIALCLQIPEEKPNWEGQNLDKYIGAGWIPYAHKYAKEIGVNLVSGETALRHVWVGSIKPEEVFVISEEDIHPTPVLRELHCNMSVLFCLESPMYTPFFYDSLPELKKLFKRQFLFYGGTDKIFFPSYETIPEWPETRLNRVCAIISNKWYWNHVNPPWHSPSYREAIRNELHTERLRTIHYYAERGELDLYGQGWENGISFPPQFAETAELIRKLNPKPVEDKIATMLKYERSICVENVKMGGYFTEKFIHQEICGHGHNSYAYIADALFFHHKYSVFAKRLLDAVN